MAPQVRSHPKNAKYIHLEQQYLYHIPAAASGINIAAWVYTTAVQLLLLRTEVHDTSIYHVRSRVTSPCVSGTEHQRSGYVHHRRKTIPVSFTHSVGWGGLGDYCNGKDCPTCIPLVDSRTAECSFWTVGNVEIVVSLVDASMGLETLNSSAIRHSSGNDGVGCVSALTFFFFMFPRILSPRNRVARQTALSS